MEVFESQNLTMPIESPDTMVPSLPDVSSSKFILLTNSPKHPDGPNKRPLTALLVRPHPLSYSPSRNIPFPHTTVRAPSNDPRVTPFFLIVVVGTLSFRDRCPFPRHRRTPRETEYPTFDAVKPP